MSKETKKTIQKKHVLAVVSVILIIMCFGATWWWLKISRTVSTDDARVKGTIVTTSAKLMGRIDKVLIREGEVVQLGQTIATIESAELEVQVAQAKANLAVNQAKLTALKTGNRPQEIAQAGAGLAQAQAQLFNAQKCYERAEQLYKQGAISIQQRDTEQTAFSVAKAQYDAATQSHSLTSEGSRIEDIQIAEAQVEQATAALKNSQLQLDNTIIKSPVSGTVVMKSVEPGEIVSAGQSLFAIANLNEVWISANIEETHIGKIKIGQSVEISIDSYPGIKFHGQVFEVGSATGSQFALLYSENTSGNFTKITQRLPVKMKATDVGDYVLKPGMSAVIDISIK